MNSDENISSLVWVLGHTGQSGKGQADALARQEKY